MKILLSDYVLATKFYNERERIPTLVENISQQVQPPKAILFVDDGSTDGSGEIAKEAATQHGFVHRIVSMPQKAKGNLDTLGRAWNKAQPALLDLLQNTDYLALTDVDTEFPVDYFGKMTTYLKANPNVGVVAGQVKGESKRSFPMFTGKVVRSDVIQSIDKYWDISIDSFVNVKALKLGYKLVILEDMLVSSPPSHLLTEKGKFRLGRLAFYSGVDVIYVLVKGIVRHDANYLRGYWSEWSRGAWRCQDKDILEYYESQLKRKLMTMVRKLLRIRED